MTSENNGKEDLEKKATKEDFENHLEGLVKDAVKIIQNAETHRKNLQKYIRDYKKEKEKGVLEYYSKKNPDGTIFYYFKPKK